jgi:hypothetical protein
MIFGALIVWFLIVEPHGLAKLWSIGKQKLRSGRSRTDHEGIAITDVYSRLFVYFQCASPFFRRQPMKLRQTRPRSSRGRRRCSVAGPRRRHGPGQGAVLPVLSYRTGPYAPNGTPWANGKHRLHKLVNARGGINGVKLSLKSAKPAMPPTAAWSATSA